MMDIDKMLPMVDGGINLEVLESKENNDGNLSVKQGFQCRTNCCGWEEKCKQGEERFGVLMSMFEKKISELESLEGKHSALQLEKLVIEDEVQSLRKRNEELEEKVACTLDGKRVMGGAGKGVEGVVDLTEDAGNDKVMELIIENKVLGCEKKKAESEVEVWKAKCKELESLVLELEQHLTSGGGECTSTVEGGKRRILFRNYVESGSQTRKQLVFGDEGSPSKKIAPATPAGVRPASLSIIDISDSEGKKKTAHFSTPDLQANKKACESTDYRGGIFLVKKQFPSKKNLTSAIDQTDEDDVPYRNGISPSMSTFKRKRAANIVTSDTESDTDDHFPISRLRKNSMIAAASLDKSGEPFVMRRLVTLRNLKEKGTSKKSSHGNSKRIQTERLRGIPTNKFSSDDEEEEEDESDSDQDGFIVNDSDCSEGDSASKDSKDDDKSNCDGALSGESDDASDGNIDYEAIIARIGRRKDHKVKWKFEADLLAAFGKDAQLCMKAVCALYRQQTSEEKFHKATIVRNERGFSQCDAYRGTKLGEFLTDGDPQGDLMKSVDELEAYDPKGLELCRTLATHYSSQLFGIYENNEDPLWPSLEPK